MKCTQHTDFDLGDGIAWCSTCGALRRDRKWHRPAFADDRRITLTLDAMQRAIGIVGTWARRLAARAAAPDGHARTMIEASRELAHVKIDLARTANRWIEDTQPISVPPTGRDDS